MIEVNESFNNVDSGQCSDILLSDSSHFNYLVTSNETNVWNEWIPGQISNDVISDADYLNDSLVFDEVLSEFEKNISNESNSDIITNVTCSHNAFVPSGNLSHYDS